MKNFVLAAAFLLALIMAGPAAASHHGCANAHHGHARPTFAEVDLDGDGGITEKELMEFRGKRMAKMTEEGRPLKNASNAPDFAAIDTDGDGAISAEEFATHQREHRCQCGAHKGEGRGEGQKHGHCNKQAEAAEEA